MNRTKLESSKLQELLSQPNKAQAFKEAGYGFIETDVFIAGSGPVACTYARQVLEGNKKAKVLMVEMGPQENATIGIHQKNAIKYQKDVNAFGQIIKGALQTVSIPPQTIYDPTIGGEAWEPGPDDHVVIHGNNPNQKPALNLPGFVVTRAVGGMATHWTCCCPIPRDEERVNNPIPKRELDDLLRKAGNLLNVHDDQYDNSIRHTVIKEALQNAFPRRGISGLPLAVERNKKDSDYVTWTGPNTILGDTVKDSRFRLISETIVDSAWMGFNDDWATTATIIDLRTGEETYVTAKAFVFACGVVGTPQLLSRSLQYMPKALGRYISEHSVAFCQIVLKKSIVDKINTDPRFAVRVKEHKKRFPNDPLPIPFNDPDPQVYIPLSSDFPYHVQIHRDSFPYGNVGPEVDPRLVADLRFFSTQEINKDNRIIFDGIDSSDDTNDWIPGVTDTYGMPQATFEVRRSANDKKKDAKMMDEMLKAASVLGSFVPTSRPQFVEPGLSFHLTGSTRIGNDPNTSVADSYSKLHGSENVWIGGNGCIPDATACNPTRTSVAIALRGAQSLLDYIATRV